MAARQRRGRARSRRCDPRRPSPQDRHRDPARSHRGRPAAPRRRARDRRHRRPGLKPPRLRREPRRRVPRRRRAPPCVHRARAPPRRARNHPLRPSDRRRRAVSTDRRIPPLRRPDRLLRHRARRPHHRTHHHRRRARARRRRLRESPRRGRRSRVPILDPPSATHGRNGLARHPVTRNPPGASCARNRSCGRRILPTISPRGAWGPGERRRESATVRDDNWRSMPPASIGSIAISSIRTRELRRPASRGSRPCAETCRSTSTCAST